MARPPRFSQRVGAISPRTVLQVGSMDRPLRVRLWNAVDSAVGGMPPVSKRLAIEIWEQVLVRPRSEITRYEALHWEQVQSAFLSKDTPWHAVYDIVELAAKFGPSQHLIADALEAGGAGYRLVDGQLIPVVDEDEIAEVEGALAQPYEHVRTHLNQALAHLGNRQEPDYRNAIKESISAVESLVKQITGRPSATLGDALKSLGDRGVEVPGALRTALSNLYGYTSAAGGIRHALTENDVNPGLAEARFMLVAVSAFVNFLAVKADQAGLKLK